MRRIDIKSCYNNLMRFNKHKLLSIIIVILCSLMIAAAIEHVNNIRHMYAEGIITGSELLPAFFNISSFFTLRFIYRVMLFSLILFFLLIHFIVRVKVFYDIVFRYRYLIATLLFLFLLVNKINFSSIGQYDFYIQTGMGSRYVAPLFGHPHAIRSDEWLVTTPVQLSAQYDPEPYGRFNYIARGTATENMPNGVALNFATFAFPMSIFYIFGAEYGISARWVGTLILTFMMAFEFAYIISGKNRLLAAAGAGLIAFSPFFQWWSYIYFITSGLGALVCFYYFINTDTRLKRLLFSIGLAVFASQFIVTLYPAWQVPAGFLYLSILIWMIVQSKENIKKLKLLDYGFMGLSIALIAGVVVTYFYNSREYIEAISNTVYPGTREGLGGGVGFIYFAGKVMLGGVFGYLENSRYFDFINVCEFGGMFTLFPIPVLFTVFIMIRRRIVDSLSIILVAFSVIFFTYIFLGWPQWLARITMMTFTMSGRIIDIFIFTQVLLLIRVMSCFSAEPENNKKMFNTKSLIASAAAGFIMILIITILSEETFTFDIAPLYILLTLIGITAVIYSIFDLQKNKEIFSIACLYLIIISTLTWLSIHPINRGLDAIYSKPLSAKVSELAVNNDEKWISLQGIVGNSYLIASGASTISSTNTYPNLDLWHKLDPQRKYEHVYNRYAVVTVELTSGETSFELFFVDHMNIKFSYNDLKTAGVKYIHTTEEIDVPESKDDMSFELLYNEGGAMIYSIDYIN